MKKFYSFLAVAWCSAIMAACSGNSAGDTSNTAPLTEATPVTETTDVPVTDAGKTPDIPPSPEPGQTPTPKPKRTNNDLKKTMAPEKTRKPASKTAKTKPNHKISMKQAKAAALKRAGLGEKDGYWEKTETDIEDGNPVYELEFISGETEYEFEVDARGGTILEYKKESIYD